MRLSPLSALLVLPATTLAVTLSDFTPRVSNLPSSCQAVYTETISGCQPSDFTGSCSTACVEALDALTSQVQSACANKGITGSNIIVAFLGGNGPGSLCSDAAAILSSSTSQAATSTSSTSSTTSSADSTTSSSSTAESSASSAVLTSTATVTAVPTTSSSGILAAASTFSSTSTSSAHGSSQTDMTGSGGGSPFDAEGNTVSGASALSAMTWTTAIFATFLAFAL